MWWCWPQWPCLSKGVLEIKGWSELMKHMLNYWLSTWISEQLNVQLSHLARIKDYQDTPEKFHIHQDKETLKWNMPLPKMYLAILEDKRWLRTADPGEQPDLLPSLLEETPSPSFSTLQPSFTLFFPSSPLKNLPIHSVILIFVQATCVSQFISLCGICY